VLFIAIDGNHEGGLQAQVSKPRVAQIHPCTLDMAGHHLYHATSLVGQIP